VKKSGREAASSTGSKRRGDAGCVCPTPARVATASAASETAQEALVGTRERTVIFTRSAQGRLAGGTIPFIRAYTTSWP
jgi:hypothetical protein